MAQAEFKKSALGFQREDNAVRRALGRGDRVLPPHGVRGRAAVQVHRLLRRVRHQPGVHRRGHRLHPHHTGDSHEKARIKYMLLIDNLEESCSRPQ